MAVFFILFIKYNYEEINLKKKLKSCMYKYKLDFNSTGGNANELVICFYEDLYN